MVSLVRPLREHGSGEPWGRRAGGPVGGRHPLGAAFKKLTTSGGGRETPSGPLEGALSKPGHRGEVPGGGMFASHTWPRACSLGVRGPLLTAGLVSTPSPSPPGHKALSGDLV